MVGATGTGKTWYGPIDSWEKVKDKPGSDFLIVGRTHHHNLTILIPYMEDWLRAVGEPFETNRSLPTIKLTRNNATFFFATAQQPNSMEGHHYSAGAWIDEAALMDRRAWEVVQRRVGMKNLPILITTIPYQTGWVKNDIYEAWKKGDPDIEYVHLSYRDNPMYDRKEIARQKRRLAKHLFDAWYEGIWSKPAGMIFYEPDDVDLLIDEFPVPEGYPMRTIAEGLDVPHNWPLFSGHDYGFTAPTAGAWAVLSPDDVLYIVAVYEESFKTIEEHVDVWKQFGLHRTMASFGDPANPGEWATSTNHGFTIVSKNVENDIRYGIDLVLSRLKTGRLKVLRGCDSWLQRREAYLWAPDPKTAGETFLDKPMPGEAEHLMDATRYLVVGKEMYSDPTGPLVMASGKTIRR